jgi:hypothetical protein
MILSKLEYFLRFLLAVKNKLFLVLDIENKPYFRHIFFDNVTQRTSIPK